MRLIDMSTSSFNTSELRNFTWLMILTQIYGYSTIILGADGSAISRVNNVNIVVESHDQIGTASRFTVLYLLCSLVLLKYLVYVGLICEKRTSHDCSLDVVREFWLQDDIVMEMLLQVFCALVSSMTIIDSKYLNFRPLLFRNLRLLVDGLNDIQNNSYSVLICLSDKAHMSICGKRADNTEFFITGLRILKNGQRRSGTNLQIVRLWRIIF